MKRPRRGPSRNARSAPNTVPLTSPQSAPKCDVPQVLERSTRRLTDVKQCADVIMGPGILVKLFPVEDSNRTLWIVGSPNANKWIPSELKEVRTANANANANGKTKASHPAKARPESAQKVKSQLIRDEAARQKNQESRAGRAEKVTEQQVQEGQDESDEMNTEPEGGEDEEEEDDTEKEDAREEDTEEEDAADEDEEEEDHAGEEDAVEDMYEDPDYSEEGKDQEEGPEKDAVMDKENGDDAEEQEGDGRSEASNGTGTEAADKREDEEYESEEGLAENNGKEGEQEAEGQPEAEREGEREGEEKGETEPHSEAREKDRAVHGGEEEEEPRGGLEAGEEQGDQGGIKGVEDNMGQRVTRNNRDEKTEDTRGDEDEERCTNAAEEENTVEDGNGRTEERRKRSSADSILEEHPNKRHKSGRDWNGVHTTTVDSRDRTIGPKAQLRPRTPPPKSTTPSTPSTIEIVRQTSVVPGLEGTECAVWDAAQRDLIIRALSPKDQKKMVYTAVSLGSDEGVKELQRFVCNARRSVKRNGESLESEFDFSASQSDANMPNVDGTLILRDRGLARFSALYQQIETLDKVATKVSITRRVKLAAMAEYRKGLLQTGLGRKQAKNANLSLFRAIHPEHAMIERPDKTENPAALVAWERLRDRLREGRLWLDIRELFGGIGAFLALPPQCVSDRYVQKMQVEKFASWLRLLDVAWRALDVHARLTLNELVAKSLAGQPLPEGILAVEMLGDRSTVLNSLSGMLTGWPTSKRISGEACSETVAVPTQHEEDDNAAAASMPATDTSITSRAEEAGDPGQVSQKKIVKSVEGELFDDFDDLDFDESLSQEI